MIPGQLDDALRLIAWDSINPVVLIDLELNILWQNKRFIKLFGAEHSLKKFLSLKSTNRFNLAEELSKGESFLRSFELAGSAINYSINFSPIKQGAKLFYMLEIAVKEDVAAAIKNVELSEILRTFSFQFRSPISRISSVTEAMEWSKKGSNFTSEEPSTLAQVEAINNGCKQLLRSFSNFVDITKYSMGLFKLELSLVSVPDFLKSLVESCQSQPAASNIPINLQLKTEKLYANFDEKKDFACPFKHNSQFLHVYKRKQPDRHLPAGGQKSQEL